MTEFEIHHVGGDVGDGGGSAGMIEPSGWVVEGCHRRRHQSSIDWPMLNPNVDTEDMQPERERVDEGNFTHMFGIKERVPDVEDWILLASLTKKQELIATVCLFLLLLTRT